MGCGNPGRWRSSNHTQGDGKKLPYCGGGRRVWVRVCVWVCVRPQKYYWTDLWDKQTKQNGFMTSDCFKPLWLSPAPLWFEYCLRFYFHYSTQLHRQRSSLNLLKSKIFLGWQSYRWWPTPLKRSKVTITVILASSCVFFSLFIQTDSTWEGRTTFKSVCSCLPTGLLTGRLDRWCKLVLWCKLGAMTGSLLL